MKIVVFGVGGVGGYFGGRLAEAGFDVTFIARGKQYDAMKLRGLQIKSILGDFKVHPNVVSNIEEIDQADLILLAVKAWQVRDVAKSLNSVISENTVVLPLQNGADKGDILCEVLDKRNVIDGLCRIVSRIESPGVIDHFAFKKPEIIFGEIDGSITDRIKEIYKIFSKANIKNHYSEDIRLDIWRKFLFITTVSGIGALTRVPFGIMREDESIRNIMYQTANEIVAIANAKNIALNNDDIENTFKAIDNTLFNTTASMQRDIMDGRPSELDNFNGYIVKQGKELHISTPANNFIYSCLLPQEKKARS